MKRVAIVGADFVPSSLPQALRIRFFARYLPEFGWQPTIITTHPRFYECKLDYENERLLPEGLQVIRTNALPARVTRGIGVGDIGMRSMWHHWRVLADLCRQELVDVLLIPVPPYVPMILGRLIYERFGVPYVIDYNDPWVTEYYWKLPRQKRPPKWALAYAMARLLEPPALRRASHIIGVSRGTTDTVLSRYPRMGGTPATEIPHGGESGDFEYLRRFPRRQVIFDPRDGFFHLSYVGACIQPMFDAVHALFSAVGEGLKHKPDLFGRLRLHFVGSTYAPNPDAFSPALTLARQHGLENVVTEHPGRVPYLDALQILLDSNCLLMVGSEEPHYTASKIFPYILAQKPLLAVLHRDSTGVRILHDTNAGETVTFWAEHPPSECIAQIETGLEKLLALPLDAEPETRWEAFEQYTTRTMARRLADVLDHVSDPGADA